MTKSTDDAPLTDAEQATLIELQRRAQKAALKDAQDKATARASQLAPLMQAMDKPFDQFVEAARATAPTLPFDDEMVSHLNALVTIYSRVRSIITAAQQVAPALAPDTAGD